MSVVKNLCKKMGEINIHIDRWEIPDEGLTLLWGPSGAGKTTVLRLLLGLESADQAYQWEFHETDLALLPSYQRKIGVVFQHLALFPHLTARKNILFPLEAAREALDMPRWQDIVERLEITPYIDKKVHSLSGGEKQRVALARALVIQPRLLILDEPFSSLDLQLKKQARNLILNTMEHYKIPVLLVSHDPQDALALAQRVVSLEDGKIKESQSAADFLKGLNYF